MKHFFLLLFSTFNLLVYSQNMVNTYSKPERVSSIIAKGEDIYVATERDGILIINTTTGNYRKISTSNTPFLTNQITSMQIFSPDTFLVSAGWSQFMYVNGFWKKLRGTETYTFAAMADDYRIMGHNDEHQDLKVVEYANGIWTRISDSITDIYNFSYFKADDNNKLYSKATEILSNNRRIVKYSAGEWSILPPFPNSPSGTVYNSESFTFDNDNNIYDRIYNNSVPPITKYYKYDGFSWQALSITLENTGRILGAGSYSNVHYVLLDKQQTKNVIWSDKNGVDNYYELDSFGLESFATCMAVTSDGKIALGTLANGVYLGTLESGFTKINTTNTCLDNLWVNTVGDGANFKEVNVDGSIVSFDTTFSNCSIISDSATNIYNDANNNHWVRRVDNTLYNLTTGSSINNLCFSAQGLGWLMLGSNAVWTYSQTFDDSEFYVCENGQNALITGVSSQRQKSVVDKFDNIWLDHKNVYSTEVYRLTKSGQLNLVTTRYSNNLDGFYETYFTRDDSGYVWIRQGDTLTRYKNDLNNDTIKVLVPHDAMDIIAHLRVFNENEIVTVSYDNVFYFHNDSLYVAPNKFTGSISVNIFSDHNRKLTFFTNDDGIQLYNFNYPDYLNGNQLSGILYWDENNNRYKEQFERGEPYRSVTINSDLYSTNNIGLYQTAVQNGEYVIKPADIPYFVAYPDSYNITASGNRYDTLHFAYSAPNPVNDLEIHITPMPFPLGYEGAIFASVKNNGTQLANATLTLNYDTALSISFSTPQPSSQQPGQATFQYNNLYPNEIVNGEIHFQMPIIFADGDSSLRFVATISPLTGDTTPANNIDSITEYPVSSYDPNDKLVSPAGLGIYNTLDTNQELTYTIRFQNTGTYKAINISLTDSLSSKLEVSSFKYIGSSATCTYSIKNHVLTINFKNINLPHADANEPGSHGYFKFSIKPDDSVTYGDSITNRAYIYFDFNEAIITNETEVTFGPVVYANNPTFNPAETITVFPQPFTNSLNFHVNKSVSLPATAQLYAVNGKVVAEKTINTATESLQTGNLAAGTYSLRLIDNQKHRFSTNCIKVK